MFFAELSTAEYPCLHMVVLPCPDASMRCAVASARLGLKTEASVAAQMVEVQDGLAAWSSCRSFLQRGSDPIPQRS